MLRSALSKLRTFDEVAVRTYAMMTAAVVYFAIAYEIARSWT